MSFCTITNSGVRFAQDYGAKNPCDKRITLVARFFSNYKTAMKTLWLALLSLLPQQTLIPVKVELITRAVNKTPVLIAYDKGIYKKYGLDVKLWLPQGEFPGAIETPGKMENADISVDGGVPMVGEILANVEEETCHRHHGLSGAVQHRRSKGHEDLE